MTSIATLSRLALAGLTVPVLVEAPANLAKMHPRAVGDVAKITAPNNASYSLGWVGGPPTGTFIGRRPHTEVGGKFTKPQAPLNVPVRDVKESGNPAGTTVTADVVFTRENTLKIGYRMLHRVDNQAGPPPTPKTKTMKKRRIGPSQIDR